MPRYRHALPQLSGDLFLTDGGLETDLIFNHGIEIREFAAHTLLSSEIGRAAMTRYFGGFLALTRDFDAGFILHSATWSRRRSSGIDWHARFRQGDFDQCGAPVTRGKIEMEDREIRAALDLHWAASDANDFEVEHQIYREDAVLEYPQSGERIRGRRNIQASRFAQPSKKRFTVRRILGAADLWVTEFILAYDGQPSYTVSIMELKDGKVTRETQYFGDAFEPGPSRAQWVERMR